MGRHCCYASGEFKNKVPNEVKKETLLIYHLLI